MSKPKGPFKQLAEGFGSIPRAARVLSAARLWHWVIAPGVLICALIPAIIVASILYYGQFALWLHGALPDWAQINWLSAIAASVLWVLGALTTLFIGSQLVLALYAPFFGIMSEKIEAHLGGAAGRPFSTIGFAKDIIRALSVLAITLSKWILWLGLAFVISWIPLIGQITSVALFFMINGYFSAMGSIDPCLERRELSIRETFLYCRQERFGLLGLGCAYQLLMLIPIIGWILAPGLLVAGASIYCFNKSFQGGNPSN
ncbi:MAG: EI24 domain-containing protein [Opitutales bacterium]